jgi:hypothetical protein
MFGDSNIEEEEHLVGEITGFAGLAGSGLATLFIDDSPVLCENTTTVRALEAAFGNIIGEGHTVNISSIIGQTIIYSVNSYGLLKWFRTSGRNCHSC